MLNYILNIFHCQNVIDPFIHFAYLIKLSQSHLRSLPDKVHRRLLNNKDVAKESQNRGQKEKESYCYEPVLPDVIDKSYEKSSESKSSLDQSKVFLPSLVIKLLRNYASSDV